MKEALKQSIDNLRTNKLRSCLTMFGIMWGVISIVILSAMGEGFQRGNQAVLQELGKNIVVVRNGRTSVQVGGERAGRVIRLNIGDVYELRNKSKLIQFVSPELMRGAVSIKSAYNAASLQISGIWPDFQTIRTIEVSHGRLINQADNEQARLRKEVEGGRLKLPANGSFEVALQLADGTEYPPDECPIEDTLRTGETHHVADDVFWRRDGTCFPVEYTSTPIQENGRLLGAVVVFRDVSKQRRAQAELRQALAEVESLKRRLEAENAYLQDELRSNANHTELVGDSQAVRTILHQIELVAPTSATVLITGESGTGKELVARAIHDHSPRRERPFVAVNCGALPETLLDSELFGHVRGAFTGADTNKKGLIEVAEKGTIFLDEIGEMAPIVQVKLLRVLQEREFEPVGSSRTIAVDVRVIAATNRDLAEAVRAGRFRADLYYRLNVFPIVVPPLRERRGDIPLLVTFFLGRLARRFGKPVDTVTAETMDRLVAYAWPGNIRELHNVVERAVVLSGGRTLDIDAALLPQVEPAPPAAAGPLAAGEGLGATLDAFERSQILGALDRTGGVIEGPAGAATLLKVHPSTLRSRMDKLGIKRPRHDGR